MTNPYIMPLDRDYLIADNSPYKLEEGNDERLRNELRQIHDPQTKSHWIEKIMEYANVSSYRADQIFSGLVLDRFLLFLRIYKGKPIYVNSATPVWFHNKMPVIELQT